MDGNFSVVLFYSTSAAIRAEKLIQQQGLKVKLIPVPRHLSSDCGVCLRFDNNDVEGIRTILKTKEIEYDGIHRM